MKLSDKMETWGFLACIRSYYSDVLGSGYCGRGETPLLCAEEVNGSSIPATGVGVWDQKVPNTHLHLRTISCGTCESSFPQRWSVDVSCCVKVGPGPDPNCSPEEREQSAFRAFLFSHYVSFI